MSEAQALEGKKRKRTGKQREEAKRAAIQAKLEAEAAEAAEAAAPAEAEPVAAEPEATLNGPAEGVTVDEPRPAEEGGKKRKRTGKQREEAKRLAIAAKLAAEGGAATTAVESQAAETAPSDTTPAGPDFAAIEKRIPPVLKKLHPVFKAAKKMESMRLIKKVKFLRGKGEEKKAEVADLEGQMKLLSALQLRAVATTHLAQKLKKHHLLKRAELPESLVALLTAEPTIAASSSSATPDAITKAENRLCSSKPVADAMKTLVAFVMGEAGASLDVRTKAAKAQKGRTAQRRGLDDGSDDESEEDSEDEEGLPLGRIEGLESDDEVVVEDKAADDAGWESGSLGGGSDDEGDDDGWESGSVSGFDGRIAPPSDSGHESDASDASDKPPRKRTKEAAPAPAQKGRTAKADGKSSMFLPSLAAGFAPAGEGDSDPDNDYDPDGIFGSKTAPRKNRRGQRARQAIWEKKYGKGANHVVKAREEEEKRKRGPQGQKRDSGWGQRGGAGAGGAGAAPAPAAPSAARPAAPASAPAPAPAGKPSEKTLHPSWEAARLRKQREAVGAKATKIVFD